MRKAIILIIGIIFSNCIYGASISKIKPKLVFYERDDPKYSLSEPSRLFLDEDSNFYLLTLGEGTIKKYNKDGVFIKRFGKRGPGPGEMSYPPGANVIGNRIYIIDSFWRKHIFDTDGKFIKTETYPRVQDKNNILFKYSAKSISETEWVASGSLNKGDQRNQGWTALALFTQNGRKMSKIFSFNIPELNVPNKRYALTDYLPDIAWDICSDGGVIYGRTDEYKLYRYRNNKSHLLISEDFQPEAIPEDIIKWAKERTAADPNGFVPLPKNRCLIHHIAIDKKDCIWVLTYSKEFKGIRKYTGEGKYVQSYIIDGELGKVKFESLYFCFALNYIFFSTYDEEEGQKIYRAEIK